MLKTAKCSGVRPACCSTLSQHWFTFALSANNKPKTHKICDKKNFFLDKIVKFDDFGEIWQITSTQRSNVTLLRRVDVILEFNKI